MVFKRYVCWDEKEIHQVLNPDAEHAVDEVFRAVHSDHPLWLVDPKDLRTRWTELPRDFLDKFLAPNRNHVQAAVIGGSGSGKSHLIHWMGLNIPPRKDQYVLSIPRSGTSLRGILENIIQVMPVERQRKYRERLDMTGYYNETLAQRRERLLDEIALAINNDSPRSGSIDVETETWMISNLPHLFHDPYYRQQYVPGHSGIIDLLVSHVTETQRQYQRVTDRRSFVREDLPTSGVDLTKMSEVARGFFGTLWGSFDLLDLAVEVINRNLDVAIGRMLNFTGDQLIGLMQDVRRSLYQEGKTLILLIEDFARIQGIDTALLDALIEAPEAERDRLCTMRWAMAVTTGYYERMPNTVQTRMNFVVDMDLPAEGDTALIHDRDIVAFAARYLNAARLGIAQLRGWYGDQSESSAVGNAPNKCRMCEHRDECHGAFGEIDSVGLYPFNARAIVNIAQQKGVVQDGFNPRRLIKDVLAEVLDNHSEELRDGRFPSKTLRDKMVEKGSGLSPAQVDQLRRGNPENYGRQRTVLELWGALGQLIRLPDGLYEAFDLPIPMVSSPPGREVLPLVKPPTTESRVTETDARVLEVRNWANGASMPERIQSKLQGLVYDAVVTYIDWDTVGLEQRFFTRRSDGFFRQRYILFRNSQTHSVRGPVNLDIPSTEDPDDLRRSALAIEGLLHFEHHHEWSFPDADRCLIALGECLEQWSTTLINQFQRLPDRTTDWIPLDMSVELLATGAALAGLLGAPNMTPSHYIDILFADWPSEAPAQAQGWQSLYQQVSAQKDELTRVLRARASGTKGGEAGAFIDATATIVPLFRLLQDWELSASVPDGEDHLDQQHSKIVNLHTRAKVGLPKIVGEEHASWIAWLKRVQQYLEPGTDKGSLLDTLHRVRDTAVNVGLPINTPLVRQFDVDWANFGNIDLAGVLQRAVTLSEAQPGVALLPSLVSSTDLQAISATEKFLTSARKLIGEITRAVDTEIQSLQRKGQGDVVKLQQSIRTYMSELGRLLTTIGGNEC